MSPLPYVLEGAAFQNFRLSQELDCFILIFVYVFHMDHRTSWYVLLFRYTVENDFPYPFLSLTLRFLFYHVVQLMDQRVVLVSTVKHATQPLTPLTEVKYTKQQFLAFQCQLPIAALPDCLYTRTKLFKVFIPVMSSDRQRWRDAAARDVTYQQRDIFIMFSSAFTLNPSKAAVPVYHGPFLASQDTCEQFKIIYFGDQ